jgi:hypothetical protein
MFEVGPTKTNVGVISDSKLGLQMPLLGRAKIAEQRVWSCDSDQNFSAFQKSEPSENLSVNQITCPPKGWTNS